MDSYQPPHPYMRPPPAPPLLAADPHLHHYPRPPPPTGSWFSGQFQYHPPPSHSPTPPPPPPPQQPQQNQWGGPNPPPYPAHPNAHYPAQPYPPLQPPPRPSQVPAPPYPPHPQPHQDWGNANWSHHSGWEYPGHSHEEDWAARAKAWASARSAMENQHPQSQFTSIARPEEPSHYSNQYSQPVESHYQDGQQTLVPTSGFQSFQGPVVPLNRPPMVHPQEPLSISSYTPDGHLPFTAKDGTFGRDMSAAFSHHEGSSNSLVHLQEVPSSYSSVPGNEEGTEGRQLRNPLLPGDGRAVQMEQAQFEYGNHSLDPMGQPLDFAPRFSHENDPKMKAGYPDSSGPAVGTDSVGVVPSLHAWTAPAAPGGPYPPITPAFPSAPQHDPSIGVPPLPGQSAPMFGRDPSFQPAVPPITAPVVLGAGAALHPSTAFPVDAYGGSLGSERPKKAAVPNWLREEIIKKKASIASSVAEHPKEGTKEIEDETIDKSTGKGEQTDSRSMDSSRSTEEEDDDEDYERAQRTAAINQEIKRILTEVLLKVTDALFDEIATEVLSEDHIGAAATADPDNCVRSRKISPSPPVPGAKASAKVLVPLKAEESEAENSRGKSSSGSPGNVLGLANYASDDDEDNQTSSVPKTDNGVVHGAGKDGHSQPETGSLVNDDGDHGNDSLIRAQDDHSTPASKLDDNRIHDKYLDNGEVHQPNSKSAAPLGKKDNNVTGDRKSIVKSDAAKSIDDGRKASVNRADVPADRLSSRKSGENNAQERDARKHDKHESRSSSGRDKEREDEKAEGPGRREERHQKKGKAQDHNSSRERLKEQGGKHGEKTREFDSRKRSPNFDDKNGKKERERDKKVSKEDGDRKRERTKDKKGDKSRIKSSSDRDRHKRRRSSSIGSRGKQSKESPVVSNGSDDGASGDSKRKVYSKRHNLSPSPDRSKRRQVSQSPHSKHTQRRHSPYSSLDTSRGRRSRSRSPVRRHR